MIRFRFSNINCGIILFISPFFLIGMYVLLSGIYFLNALKEPIPIYASIDTVFSEQKMIGTISRTTAYQVSILKTSQYPCSLNLGEKNNSLTKSLLRGQQVLIYIRQKDRSKLMTSNEINILGLIVDKKTLISLDKTLLNKQQALKGDIQLGILALVFTFIILFIGGCRRGNVSDVEL